MMAGMRMLLMISRREQQRSHPAFEPTSQATYTVQLLEAATIRSTI
jgi:hypothetical protein